MKKKNNYIALYYVCFAISIVIYFMANFCMNNIIINPSAVPSYTFKKIIIDAITVDRFSYGIFNVVLALLNLGLVIAFTILLKTKKLDKANTIMPITYIIFSILTMIICFLFNFKLILLNIQFSYYYRLIFVGYLLLNIYSILSFKKKK